MRPAQRPSCCPPRGSPRFTFWVAAILFPAVGFAAAPVAPDPQSQGSQPPQTSPAPPAAPSPQGAATPQASPKLSESEPKENEEFVATFAVTQADQPLGKIMVRLHHKYAPNHVRNFVKLAETSFYDGTLFHRIGPESFIQGGDPLSRDADPANDGSGGPGYFQQAEINSKQNVRGALSVARQGTKDSGSQFFICLKDHPEWDSEYTVFGNVMSGMEVADRIGAAKRHGDRPVDPIRMKVTVEKRVKQVKLY